MTPRTLLRIRSIIATILVAAAAIVSPGCRGKEPSSPAPSENADKSGDATGEASEQDAGVTAAYPLGVGSPDPLAQRLCNALHALPQEGKAICCSAAQGGSLASECERTLSISLRENAVAISREDVDRCVEDARRELEGCDWVTPLAPPAPESCRGVVHGRIHTGGRCRSSLECEDGLFCRGGGPTAIGACAEPAPVGSPCSAAADTLASTTRQADDGAAHPECAGACQAGRCVAFAALGEDCRSSRQCQPGARCASGRCTDDPLPRIGEACTGSACEKGAFCLDGKCAALKAAGEPCTSPFECRAACVRTAGSKVGTCGMQCGSAAAIGSPPTPTSR